MEKITSLNNQEIKNIIKLRKARERKNQNVFVIEGRHEISLAITSGVEIQKTFFCSDFVSDESFAIDIQNSLRVTEEVFRKISLRETPDGCLAIAKIKERKLSDIKLKPEALVLVLEALEKPGNIGAILRTADATNVDVVLFCDVKTDVYNPNVIRASLGTVFTNTLVKCTFDEAQSWLKNNNVVLYATTPSATNNYSKEKYSKRTAIVIGTEHEGLSEQALNSVDKKIFIPMFGKIDSLNASVSTAIVLYEVIRQRNK